MLKKIALIALFLAVVFSACANGQNGCTTCEDGDNCDVCDQANFYFKKADKTCDLQTGCKTYAGDACTACDETKFYFPKIANDFSECKLFYNCKTVADQKCTVCADAVSSTHSIQEGECLKTCKSNQKLDFYKIDCEDDPTKNVNSIAGCTAEADGPSSKTQCKTCVAGTTLSTSATKCVTNVQNCQTYNDTECDQCNTGFKINAATKACEAEGDATENVNNIAGCTAKADGADAETKCKTCKSGTTLAASANKCVTNVKDCETYNDTGCGKCKTGFKLNASTKACEQDKTSSSSSTASSAFVSASLAVILAVFSLVL